MTILFYAQNQPYGEFSNFSRHGFQLKGQYWKTVEHYFQAMKFEDAAYGDQVRQAPHPKQAKQLGRRRDWPLRDDWENIKDAVMYESVLAKFHTHSELRDMLLATGDADIVENAPSDYYWGCGADGSGKNMLGKILMRVRAVLRAQQTD